MVNAVLLAACVTFPNANVTGGGVPPRILDSLTRGVNVTRWFCYLGPGDQTDHFKNYLTPKDYDVFANLGVKFVRLCISPDAIYSAGGYKPEVMDSIDAAVQSLNKHRITVIWDLHDNGQLKLDTKGDRSGFLSFWGKVAAHYRGMNEGQLIFELLNEPQFQKNSADWYTLQNSAVEAIRSKDADRTIVVSGTSWSGIATLAAMQPLTQKNLIYTFHCYDPFFFTHQGGGVGGRISKQVQTTPLPQQPKSGGQDPSSKRSQIPGNVGRLRQAAL